MIIQMKGISEQYFPVELLIMLSKVVLTSVDEIVKCDYLNMATEKYFFCSAVCFSSFSNSKLVFFCFCTWAL